MAQITSIAELDRLYGEPVAAAIVKEIDYISDDYRVFVDKAPFVVIATVGPEGLDCSPRGDPAGFVKDGAVPAANYFINTYTSFPDQNFARKAVRFERRIELGMEGHRFFDLVRWGIAAEEKNTYFQKEKIKRTHLTDAYFQAGKNEVLPIPQKAIDLSQKNGAATLAQNPGY